MKKKVTTVFLHSYRFYAIFKTLSILKLQSLSKLWCMLKGLDFGMRFIWLSLQLLAWCDERLNLTVRYIGVCGDDNNWLSPFELRH